MQHHLRHSFRHTRASCAPPLPSTPPPPVLGHKVFRVSRPGGHRQVGHVRVARHKHLRRGQHTSQEWDTKSGGAGARCNSHGVAPAKGWGGMRRAPCNGLYVRCTVNTATWQTRVSPSSLSWPMPTGLYRAAGCTPPQVPAIQRSMPKLLPLHLHPRHFPKHPLPFHPLTPHPTFLTHIPGGHSKTLGGPHQGRRPPARQYWEGTPPAATPAAPPPAAARGAGAWRPQCRRSSHSAAHC
jgi:hypothetical protein